MRDKLLKKENSIKEVKEISAYGGYICPICGATFLTKKGYILIPGEMDCAFCKCRLSISERICESANQARILYNMTSVLLRLR